MSSARTDIAYFSMEIMLETDIPSYAGGLGVLAGDVLRSCADMHINTVGVSLVYSGNIFNQVVEPDGTQHFDRSEWQRLDQLTKLPNKITIQIAGQPCVIGCWSYDIVSIDGFVVPVYLLDTNLVENPPWLRDITQYLYATGDNRFLQEMVLGIGGVAMLRDLGIHDVGTYHLNEGHCALVTLALLAERNYQDDAVRKSCVFTTHTPVPEGHDKFDYGLAWHYAKDYLPLHINKLAGDSCLSMTDLAASLSRVNLAVSQKHQLVSSRLFPQYHFDFVTNGVHHRNWTHNYMQDLYNEVIPGWLDDPKLLKNAADIPDDDLWHYHQECKLKLIRYVNRRLTSVSTEAERENPGLSDQFDTNTLTISLARRPVAYKRPLLLYQNLERFVNIGAGRLQIIQCGKSHPDDDVSKGIVQEIIRLSKSSRGKVKIAYLENYSPKIARLLVSGSDVWLNTPKKPLEASGTSGMKAALNGVLNFSVLDGWWIEAQAIDPLSGFTLGHLDEVNDDYADSQELYSKLESEIIPLYYGDRTGWIARMKHAIALGGYFNTHRVVSEYLTKAWNKN